MSLTSPTFDIDAMARALDAAWRTRAPVQPFSDTYPEIDAAAAYAIQSRWAELRQDGGDTIVGRKIGLTAKAVQQQLGVDEPDYGALWRSSAYEPRNGRVEIPAADFLQPRIEGEVAFLMAHDLPGGGVTAAHVLSATAACALGVEIVDSRIADWRIKLVDTIADNASFGGFAVGPWDDALPARDLATLKMRITLNGQLAAEGSGAAVLGNPAKSVAWLANKLGEFGVMLRKGDVVISGAITRMLPAKAGDTFAFGLTGQPGLEVAFR